MSACFYPSPAFPTGNRSISWPIRWAAMVRGGVGGGLRLPRVLSRPPASAAARTGAAVATRGASRQPPSQTQQRDPAAHAGPAHAGLLVARPQLGRGVPEYLAAANDEVVLIIQVETRQCYEDLEARPPARSWRRRLPAARGAARHARVQPLPVRRSPEVPWCVQALQAVLSVPGVTCCFMGPVDLSHALGLAQRLGFPACFDSPDFQASDGALGGRAAHLQGSALGVPHHPPSPLLQDCLQRVSGVCRDKGVTPGNFALSEAKAREMLAQGFTLLATGTDVGLMGEAAARNAALAGKLRGQQA